MDNWERLVRSASEEVLSNHIKVPINANSQNCWYQECSGGNLMSDAARWYLESNNYIGQLWRDTITATVWHGGAMTGTIPGKSAQNFANQINYFDFFFCI